MGPERGPAMTGPSRKCVRCGAYARAPELLVCVHCKADPDRLREQAVVAEAAMDYSAQRRLLVERFGWYGGWPRTWA